jgi:hypothetical protein
MRCQVIMNKYTSHFSSRDATVVLTLMFLWRIPCISSSITATAPQQRPLYPPRRPDNVRRGGCFPVNSQTRHHGRRFTAIALTAHTV